MPRVIGIDIPSKKRLVISLTYIYGIGLHRSKEILERLGLNPDMHAEDLTQEQIVQLNSLLTSKEYTLEGELRRQIHANIQRLKSINCYRGIRHRLNLPTRGQRTKSNARTRKGKRRTVAGKKKAPGPK